MSAIKPSKRLASGASLLVLGTVLGQAVIILCSPILTRMYSPAEFGVLAVYVSMFAFVTVIASLRYELAIALPRVEGFAVNIVSLCLALVVFVVLLTSLLLSVIGQDLVELLNAPLLEPFLWLLPLGVLIGGVNKVFSFFAFRKNAFAVVALSRFLQGGGGTAVQISLGFLQVGFVGLIAGHVAGFACGLLCLLVLLSFKSDTFRPVKLRRMLIAAKRYRHFPIYSTWSDMLNVFGTQFPIVFIASFFSPAAAGLYMLANRVANAPVALVAEAVAKSFMVTAATKRGSRQLPELSLCVFRLLLRIGLGPLVIVAVIAPELFDVVFGEDWAVAGDYLRLMIPWIISVFVIVPLMSLYVVLELQRVELKFQFFLFFFRMTGLASGALLGGIVEAIMCFSIAAAFSYIVCGFWVLCEAGVKLGDLIRAVVKETLVVLCIGGGMWLFRDYLSISEPSIVDPSSLALLGLAAFLIVSILIFAKPILTDIASVEK